MSAKTKIAAVAAAATVAAASSTVATRDWVEKFVASQISAYDAELVGGDDDDSGDSGDGDATMSSRTNACLVVRKSNVSAVPFGTYFYKSGTDGVTNVFGSASAPGVRVLYVDSLLGTTVELSSGAVYAASRAEGGMTYFYSDGADGYFALGETLATDNEVKEGLGK